MQSRKRAHVEVLTNQISGIIMGWLIVFFILPLIGVPFTAPQATLATFIFFLSSYSRMYVIRRIFNNKDTRDHNEKQEKKEKQWRMTK